MKIYEKEEKHLMRLNIKKVGFQTEFVTLCETTQKETIDLVDELIKGQRGLVKDRVTSIEIRESIGSKNGKSVTVSFKGMNPKEVKELIVMKVKSLVP